MAFCLIKGGWSLPLRHWVAGRVAGVGRSFVRVLLYNVVVLLTGIKKDRYHTWVYVVGVCRDLSRFLIQGTFLVISGRVGGGGE